MKDKKKIILVIIAVIGLIVITVGTTYAFFNYVKKGTTENTITSGTITFLYTEVSEVGRGIKLEDALPVSDEVGKSQIGEGNVFDFKVTSTTPNKMSIPYEVTVRKKKDSTLDEEAVKIYLTEVDGAEDEILLDNYSNLENTSVKIPESVVEKTIYKGTVPSNSSNYEKNFRLRMWLDESIDFSPVKDEEGNDTYPYNGKTFTVTVNVYANGEVVTTEENVSKPKVGDYVQMTPTLASYSTDTILTGYSSSQTIYPQELNLWRVLKINDNGTIELISEYTSSTNVYFKGQTGYKNFVGYLNELASKYENSKYTTGSRYVGYDGQTEYLTDTADTVDSTSTTAPWTSSTTDNSNESLGGGDILYQNDYDLMQSALGTRVAYKLNTTTANAYWFASRKYNYNSSNDWNYKGRFFHPGYALLIDTVLYDYDSGSFNSHDYSFALRPIVILKSDISYTPALGTSDSPFILE